MGVGRLVFSTLGLTMATVGVFATIRKAYDEPEHVDSRPQLALGVFSLALALSGIAQTLLKPPPDQTVV